MKKVIIIGAGIVGATSAYHLAKRGVAVTVIDAYFEGRATSASAGIICPWVSKRRNKEWYKLAKNGAAYYETLMNELQGDGFSNTGYKKVGAIQLHEDMAKLEEFKAIAIARREAAPEIGDVQILDSEAVRDKFPLIKDDYAGLYISGAARVDGRLLRDTLLDAAVLHGANLVEGVATFNSDEQGRGIVKVDGNELEADHIIAANGVWMKELFSPLQIDLKLHAQKGEIIHLQVNDIDTSTLPVIMPPNSQYMLSFDDGRIVVGASRNRVDELNTDVSVEGTHFILDRALQIAPDLALSSIIETRVGFRPNTFNRLPVFGPLPTQPHIFLANGLGASGLTTGPYIGKQLAHLITNEQTDLPVDAYAVDQIIT